MHEKHEKTNAMRQLDRKKAAYTVHSYDGGALSGTEVASALGKDPERCFKTLVTVGKTGGHYVFMIPVAAELDLRKAASAAGEKSVAMLPQKELLPLTGYIHGGAGPPARRRWALCFRKAACKGQRPGPRRAAGPTRRQDSRQTARAAPSAAGYPDAGCR